MNYLIRWIVLGVIGSFSLLISSCSTETQSKNISDKDSTATIPVEVAATNSGEISAYYSSTATLEADQQAMVVAKVQGIVQKLNAEEGDLVQSGDVLAQLDDEQLQLEADRAKAILDRLKNELDRKQELYRKNLISAQEFENAKYEFQAQHSAYELAQLQLRHAQIKAPINGVISKRLIKVGNMISTNQETFQITDFDPLLAVVNVPEHEMNKLKVGQPALVQVDAVAGRTFNGQILRISPTVNPETGTFEATISLKDESRQLNPGMFGRIRIVYDTRRNALMVPKNAVLNEDGINSVFLIKNKLAFRKTVKTGYTSGDSIEILEGLSPADTVVTIGQSSLQDSSLVEVVSF